MKTLETPDFYNISITVEFPNDTLVKVLRIKFKGILQVFVMLFYAGNRQSYLGDLLRLRLALEWKKLARSLH